MTSKPVFDEPTQPPNSWPPRNIVEALQTRTDAVADTARTTINSWHSRYPPDHQPAIATRLRSDDSGFWGAYAELFLHEVFTRAGATIDVEPHIPGGTPDFRITLGADQFLLEAKVLLDPEAERISDKGLTPILEAFATVESADFLIRIREATEGTNQPSKKSLSAQLTDWLETLDWETARNDLPNLPNTTITHRDWSIDIEAIARAPDRRQLTRIEATRPAKGRWVNDHLAITKALKEKARRYRSATEDLAIAVINTRWTQDNEEMNLALYGPAWEHPHMMQRRRIDPNWTNTPEGFWITRSGPRYEKIAGVLAATDCAPWALDNAQLTVWHNPSRPHALTSLPFAHVKPNQTTGNLDKRDPDVALPQLLNRPPHPTTPTGIPDHEDAVVSKQRDVRMDVQTESG